MKMPYQTDRNAAERLEREEKLRRQKMIEMKNAVASNEQQQERDAQDKA